KATKTEDYAALGLYYLQVNDKMNKESDYNHLFTTYLTSSLRTLDMDSTATVDADSLRWLHAKFLAHTKDRIEVLQKLESPVDDFGLRELKLEAKLKLQILLEENYKSCLDQLDNVEINRFEHCSKGLIEKLQAYKDLLAQINEAKNKFENEYNFSFDETKSE
ncbi:MAG: hypothetical protein ACPGLV_14295, partial [Bacteroidia bacterium]